MSDGSYDIEGCNYGYKDGAWVDTYGMNKGSALIFVNAENVGDYTDAIIAQSNFEGYYKAGDNCNFSACFVNAGTTDITSFDAIVEVGGNKTTQHFADQAEGGLQLRPQRRGHKLRGRTEPQRNYR